MPSKYAVTFIHRDGTKLTIEVYGPFPIVVKARERLIRLVKDQSEWNADSYRIV